MKKQYVLIFLITVLSTSCKTISVQNKQYQTTQQKVTLGSVGIDETFDLEKTYSYLGIPNYIKPIKVQITPISFNNKTFKAYHNAKELQQNSFSVTYIDSLAIKPKFLNIETSDKIGLIGLLNTIENQSIKTYLQNQNRSHVLTNISVVLNENDMTDLMKAEEVFMEQTGLKVVGLKLYSNDKVTRTISFNEGVVFAYRASSVCWKENSKYQLEIVDLVEGDNKCPNEAYSSAKRAKKEVDYFKF